MTVKKDPKRQLLGKIAKARGKQFESRIDDSFAYYAQKGFAIIEKTPEPMHPTKNLGNGKFIAYYEKQAQPDYAAIGKAVGRSEKCVRSKVYNDYLTENADKVREMLGDGAWGHGAPEMDVRHGFYISRTRHQVRRDLSALATVLRKRMNDLGYDPYWQRFMCMNWDDIGGCSAGCTDCDSCTAFRRIQPQYCARCGGTFYERKENRFCAACRTARKKQAQRHWCRVNGMSRK